MSIRPRHATSRGLGQRLSQTLHRVGLLDEADLGDRALRLHLVGRDTTRVEAPRQFRLLVDDRLVPGEREQKLLEELLVEFGVVIEE